MKPENVLLEDIQFFGLCLFGTKCKAFARDAEGKNCVCRKEQQLSSRQKFYRSIN